MIGLSQSREATHTITGGWTRIKSGRLNIQPPTNFTSFKDLNELKDVAMREFLKEEDAEEVECRG